MVVFTVTLFLMIPGIVYGIVIGKYKSDKDVWADISQGFAEMGNYVFMCFFISIFTNFFSISKLGTILAPVFIPMMMLMGFDPAITQVVYRIGDSITNPLSPLFTYMPVLLGFAHKYDEKVGLGPGGAIYL